jgi:hypothetical protein
LAADPANDDLRANRRFKAIVTRLESAAAGELKRFTARRQLADEDAEALGSSVAAAN